MKRFFLLAALLLHSIFAAAQGRLEVLPLKHRSAEQVMPILQPLLDAGGALSGQGYQLFVRTSPRNFAEIRKALAAIDLPQRRLMISVRFESAESAAGNGIRMGGALHGGGLTLGTQHFANEAGGAGRSRLEARTLSSRSASDEPVEQRVQVLEGARAFVSTGRSQPVRQRRVVTGPGGTLVEDNSAMQEANTGFTVVPRVSGDRVTLEISPKREAFVTPPVRDGGASAVRSEQVASSVSGRLGEWIELGGSLETGVHGEGGVFSSRDARTGESRRIWVRVEERVQEKRP